MKKALFIGFISLGCLPPPTPAPVAPDEAARPAGKGWQCYEWQDEREGHEGERLGKCFRDAAECEDARSKDSSKPTPVCVASSSAHCFTITSPKDGKPISTCAPRPEECKSTQRLMQSVVSPRLNPSPCAVWE